VSSRPSQAGKDAAAILTQGSSDSGTSDSGYPVKVGGKYNAAAPTFSDGQRGDLQLDTSGNLKITGAVWAITSPGSVTGQSVYRNINLGTSGVNIKGSAGNISGWYIANNAAYAVFVKFYNKATAPVVGTDTPVFTIQIPASSATNVNFAPGINFPTGIGIGASKAVGDGDSTALATNDCVANILWN
jgi:hypothetical protein